MKLSKHHYAIELADRGNTVYFLDPALKSKSEVVINEVQKNLRVVQYPFIARGRNKMPEFLYNFFVNTEVKKIFKSIGVYPDIVWCFDPERLDRLPYFKNALKIFHPVDFFPHRIKNNFFDVVFSSIKRQVEDFKKKGNKAFFINHGLSEFFRPFSEKRLHKLEEGNINNRNKQNIKAGYVGNLIGGPPDRETMRKVVEQHPEIEFHFWGQYERSNSTLSFHDFPEVFDFIDFLKNQKNVFLHGPVDTENLATAIQDMDMFWICWKIHDDIIWNKYTNPHKLIEYLSTGKSIVSHHIDIYKNNFVASPDNEDNTGYPQLFEQVLNNVRKGDDDIKEIERIKYALDNTYKKQIEKIEKIIYNDLN